MPRKAQNKPWLHTSSGYWCATLHGKRVYLDKDFAQAKRKLAQLKKEAKQPSSVVADWLEQPLAVLADEYLSDVQARRKPATYQSCRYNLLRALRILGSTLRVGEIRKLHLSRIEQAMARDYSPTTIKDTLARLQAVFNWAVCHDLLDLNPLAGYKKPAARTRNRIIQPAEFQALLRASDVNFRRVLITLRMTGCRPGELRTLIWEWVDLQEGLWILPDHKTVTRQRQPRPRVIPLPEPVLTLCRWLARKEHQPSDHVFLNLHGRPYSKDCFVRKMSRVRDRAGVQPKAGERIVMYSNRHTYATEALGRVTDTELAEVLGHTDTQMLRRYTHLNAQRLLDIQRRVQR